MTRPQTYLIRMLIFLGLVGLAGAVLFIQLQEAFFANAILNGMILGVLIFGVLYVFRQVLMLNAEVRFLEHLKAESEGGIIYPDAIQEGAAPRLLRPMVRMLKEKRGRLALSTLSMRTLLDGIQTRIGESHDISRYLIGLLIFLGLLGTFWGLLETVSAVGATIGSLGVTPGGDPATMFEQLRDGLSQPLSGMGTAFSSSLFGLAGSLVLGFLELQAGQAHNRFMNELEEWLSGMTRLSSAGPGGGEGDGSVPAYLSALMEQNAESLERLQIVLERSEDERANSSRNLAALADRLSTMTDQMRTEQDLMRHLAEGQKQLQEVLTKLGAAEGAAAGEGLDATSRDHIRNISTTLNRMAEEMTAGREASTTMLRNEIRILTRTIAALAEESSE
jgi:hypothetical protein